MASASSVPDFAPGQRVWWLHTLGGGSTHRVAPKRRRAARVVAVTPRSARIEVFDRPTGARETRVRLTSLARRA